MVSMLCEMDSQPIQSAPAPPSSKMTLPFLRGSSGDGALIVRFGDSSTTSCSSLPANEYRLSGFDGGIQVLSGEREEMARWRKSGERGSAAHRVLSTSEI